MSSVGLVWWLLAREVLRLRGSLSRTEQWAIMPDLYFYRDLEAEAAAPTKEEGETAAADEHAPAAPTGDEWNAAPAEWAGAAW